MQVKMPQKKNLRQPWLSMAGPSWPFFLNGQCRIRIIFIGRSKTAADIWFCLDTDEWLAEKGTLSVIEKF